MELAEPVTGLPGPGCWGLGRGTERGTGPILATCSPTAGRWVWTVEHLAEDEAWSGPWHEVTETMPS